HLPRGCGPFVHRAYSVCFHLFVADICDPDIYTLSLHDALPILSRYKMARFRIFGRRRWRKAQNVSSNASLSSLYLILANSFGLRDRKSTRLNSSHVSISYAVFCLKKKTT